MDYFDIKISNYFIGSLVGLFLIICITYKYHIFFLENLENLLLIYFILINIFSLYLIATVDLSLYDYEGKSNGLCTFFYNPEIENKFRFFFVEPSHFAFVSNAAILTGGLYLSKKNLK